MQGYKVLTIQFIVSLLLEEEFPCLNTNHASLKGVHHNF